MAVQQTVTLTRKIPFQAGQEVTFKLDTVGYITRIELLLRLNVTTDATNGGVPAEDALARIIKSLRVEVPGGRPFFAVPDGRILKYMNVKDLGKVYEDALPTAAGVTADVYAKYYVYFGFEPADPFDPTVVIPARRLSDLQMVVRWGDATDLGTGYTINDGEITVTLRRIVLEADESEEDIWPEGINQPVMQPSELTIDAVKGELGLQDNLPTGNVLREAMILVLDSADNRSDAEVSEVGIVIPETQEKPFRVEWRTLVRETAMDAGLDAPVAGFAVIDFEDVAGHPIGLDLSMAEAGEWKLGFSTLRTGGRIKITYLMVT